MPATKGAAVPGDGSQGSGKEELLGLQVFGVFVLLVELAVEATHHGVEEAPLSLLPVLQEPVTLLELFVSEVLCRVISDLVLVVLAPIAVLPVSAYADVTDDFLEPLHDLEPDVLAHHLERVAEEGTSSVRVSLELFGEDDLVGQDLCEGSAEAPFQHVEGVSLAWHQVLLPRHDLLEEPHRRQRRPNRRAVDRRVLLPMATVQVSPGFDGAEVVKQLPHQLQVLSIEGHLAMPGQLASSPEKVAEGIVLFVVVPLRVLQTCLSDEADMRPIHPCLLVALHILQAVDYHLHLVRLVGQQELGNGIQTGHGIVSTFALGVRQPQAVGNDTIVAQPAAKHAGPAVIALGIGRRRAERACWLPRGVLALCLAGVQGLVLQKKGCQLIKLLHGQGWLQTAKLS
mmetsp:Transcript_117995/g.328838  ORF Transcript_117995/g.328838 Transcript_117995/m.328838 type:complete len:399 (+) Transcript_117995:504-1700(+)